MIRCLDMAYGYGIDSEVVMVGVPAIEWRDSRVLKVWNFSLIENPEGVIIDSLAVLLGDYPIYRKHAASLILKILLRDHFRAMLLNEPALFPYDRNDPRVKEWAAQVVSFGSCELCGSTEDLEAHHVIRWADYPMGRLDVQNGMCLCLRCHTREHIGDQSYHLMKGKIKRRGR